MLSQKQLLFWDPRRHDKVLSWKEKKKNKESRDPRFNQVYFMNKLFDFKQLT